MAELGVDEASVGAVLASDTDSRELRVDAMLCLDGVRRITLSGCGDEPGMQPQHDHDR